MERIVSSNPDIMHGAPCFAGTRVAAQSLFDHLKAGYTIDGFLTEFPTVKREHVFELLWTSKFATSQDKLAALTNEALAEFEAGRTLPLVLDRDFPKG